MTIRNRGFALFSLMSIVFLLLSLIGTIYLVKINQDNRNKATCLTDSRCNNRCDYVFCAGCVNSCQLISTKTCNQIIFDKCNTSPTYGQCNDMATISTRCITAKSGTTLPQFWKYKCPGKMDFSGGCQQNGQYIPAGATSICFDNNFCGAQQIDTTNYKDCFIETIDWNCVTPTVPISHPSSTPSPTKIPTTTLVPTKIPTLTPTSTVTPTNTPTNTPIPSSTPTGTVVPTSTPTKTPTLTPTNTPGPTNTPTSTPTGTVVPTSTPTKTPTLTPTNTPGPTNTPVYLAQGPSPTRIVLPSSGVEFPSQILGMVGLIVTLAGFLILL